MILVLARGHYCPRDNQQHLQLAAFIRRSPSPTPRSSPSRPTTSSRPTSSAPQSAPSGPSCPTPGGRYRRTWTSRNTPIPHHDPMIPHTFVLKPGLVIYSVYNGYWYWGRPSIEDLRRDLREVTREIRPDWDLASPGLRELATTRYSTRTSKPTAPGRPAKALRRPTGRIPHSARRQRSKWRIHPRWPSASARTLIGGPPSTTRP